MRLLALGCVLAGCGRFGFSSQNGTGLDASSDAKAIDAAIPMASACAISALVNDPITVSGETFEYTGVNNMTGRISGVSVTATSGGTQLAQATSDMVGMYSLSLPTGGQPLPIEIDYAPNGYWLTQLMVDQPLDRDAMGPNMTYWRLGDGPSWSLGEMASVYSYGGKSIDPAKGTINIAVRDCAEIPLEGVTIAVTPAAEELAYVDAVGAVNPSITTTTAPYGHAVAFNAVPGPTHITATKDGTSFYAFDINVTAGAVTALVVMHVP